MERDTLFRTLTASLVLQARAVVEEAVPPEAIAYVLEPVLDAAAAWVLYERGDLAAAITSAAIAIKLFDEISHDDAAIVRHLHAAFEWAGDRDRAEEGRELWAFVSASFKNPDLVRCTTVAGRILELGTAVDADTRRACQAFIETERAEIGRTLAALAV